MVGIRERNATYPLPFMEGKVGRNSIFNLLHIPYNSHKERLFFYHCTEKGNHFSRWKKNTGMRLIVKYLLPCSAMFYMPFINSVKFIFATKEMSYESGRCKGVVLPQKSEADAKGNCPVMARLNVGKYSEAAFSVKMSVPHTMWHSGRATGKSVAARESTVS